GDEPIIFVEVALTRKMSACVQPLLAADSPVLDIRSAKCATFYSITNCQEGLRGIPFGDFLIKQVVEDLSRELRQIGVFATLSPVPSFRSWLEQAAPPDVLSRLEESDWLKDEQASRRLKQTIEPWCAHYLL